MLLFFHRDVDITSTSSHLYHPSTSKEASCLNVLPSLNSVVGNPCSSFSEISVPQQSPDSESDESGESYNDDFCFIMCVANMNGLNPLATMGPMLNTSPQESHWLSNLHFYVRFR